MVISSINRKKSAGFVMAEMTMAMVILVVAMIPLGYSALSDARLLRIHYQRAVAMEIVDGEMEILAAGDWRHFPEGTHPFAVHAQSAANLPRGEFVLTRDGFHLRLEWKALKKSGLGPVVREVTVQ